MRWIGRLVIAALAIVLFVFAMANRQAVHLRLTPDVPPLDRIPSIEAPLFAVLFVTLFAGYLVGTLIEWTRNVGMRNDRRGPRE